MEYWWIPLATGLLAFLGSMGGHFVSFNLNTRARRREVRRTQIEKLAEYIAEDQTWMNEYRQEACFRNGKFATTTSPKDKAHAIFYLYFKPELSQAMSEFIKHRHAYQTAIDNVYSARIQSVIDKKTPSVELTKPDKAQIEKVIEAYKPYYNALLDTVIASSTIARETIE